MSIDLRSYFVRNRWSVPRLVIALFLSAAVFLPPPRLPSSGMLP